MPNPLPLFPPHREMEFPPPPPHASIQEMHKWMQVVYRWMAQTWTQGLQAPFFLQTQLDNTHSLSQSGKIFFNRNTGKFCVGEIENGELAIKTITTS